MSKIYMISYDLNSPGQNYDKLISEIKTYNGWCKVLKSLWFVYSDKTAADICNHLHQFVDQNDHIFVNELTTNRQGWLSQNVWDWINKYQ